MSEPLDGEIELRLTTAELVVLSNGIHRLLNGEAFEKMLDAAEQVAFWNLNAVLEKANPTIFATDYELHIREAKALLVAGPDQ